LGGNLTLKFAPVRVAEIVPAAHRMNARDEFFFDQIRPQFQHHRKTARDLFLGLRDLNLAGLESHIFNSLKSSRK